MSSLLLTGAGPSNGGGGAPPFVGPFDALDATNLYAAICPGHRLYGASDPDVVRVRRLSDATNQDFKATTGALGADVVTFCGAADGTTPSHYDQGGLAHHFAVASGNGPRILTGAALVAFGSGVAPDYGFGGSSTPLQLLLATIPQPFTVMSAFVMDTISSGRGVMNNTGGAGGSTFIAFNSSGNLLMNAGTALLGPVLSTGTKYISTCRFNGASSDVRVNGVNGTPGNAGTNAPSAGTVRIGIGNLSHADGRIGITLIFTESISDAKAAAYEAAIAAIFGSFP